MRLLQIEAKEINIIFEEKFSNLEKLVLALDMAKIEYDGTTSEETEAANYLTKEFYPFIKEIIEKIKGEKIKGE